MKIENDKQNPENEKQLKIVLNEVEGWVREISKISEVVSQEEKAELEKMISEAVKEVNYAGRVYASLLSDIMSIAKNYRQPQPNRSRIAEDKSQVVALAEHAAFSKVYMIEKFNKKRNRKSFLNIGICKFKKSKLQESKEREKGSSEPSNN